MLAALLAMNYPRHSGKPRPLFPGHLFQLHLPGNTDVQFAEWFERSPVEQKIGAIVEQLLGPASPYNYTQDEWMVVDAGMNRGYQSLLPAALGYEVLAVEAMPQCVSQASTTFRLNNLTGVVTTVLAGLAAQNGGTMGVLPNAPCNAANSIVAAADSNGNHTGDAEVRVHLRSLASLLSPLTKGVAVMKMDIEGSEMAALQSFGVAGFAAHRARHLIVEVASHLWRHSLESGVRFFEALGATSEGVYCLDPSHGCLFEMKTDPVFGTVYQVLDMKRTISRVHGRSCCGNLWFRGIGNRPTNSSL